MPAGLPTTPVTPTRGCDQCLPGRRNEQADVPVQNAIERILRKPTASWWLPGAIEALCTIRGLPGRGGRGRRGLQLPLHAQKSPLFQPGAGTDRGCPWRECAGGHRRQWSGRWCTEHVRKGTGVPVHGRHVHGRPPCVGGNRADAGRGHPAAAGRGRTQGNQYAPGAQGVQ